MSYRDPEWRWLVPFARWLRKRRLVGCFGLGLRWAEDDLYGYDCEQAAWELWPKDADLREAFKGGGMVGLPWKHEARKEGQR